MSLLVLIGTQARMIGCDGLERMIAHISEVSPLLAFRCRGRLLLLVAAHISVRMGFLIGQGKTPTLP